MGITNIYFRINTHSVSIHVCVCVRVFFLFLSFFSVKLVISLHRKRVYGLYSKICKYHRKYKLVTLNAKLWQYLKSAGYSFHKHNVRALTSRSKENKNHNHNVSRLSYNVSLSIYFIHVYIIYVNDTSIAKRHFHNYRIR